MKLIVGVLIIFIVLVLMSRGYEMNKSGVLKKRVKTVENEDGLNKSRDNLEDKDYEVVKEESFDEEDRLAENISINVLEVMEIGDRKIAKCRIENNSELTIYNIKVRAYFYDIHGKMIYEDEIRLTRAEKIRSKGTMDISVSAPLKDDMTEVEVSVFYDY